MLFMKHILIRREWPWEFTKCSTAIEWMHACMHSCMHEWMNGYTVIPCVIHWRMISSWYLCEDIQLLVSRVSTIPNSQISYLELNQYFLCAIVNVQDPLDPIHLLEQGLKNMQYYNLHVLTCILYSMCFKNIFFNLKTKLTWVGITYECSQPICSRPIWFFKNVQSKIGIHFCKTKLRWITRKRK